MQPEEIFTISTFSTGTIPLSKSLLLLRHKFDSAEPSGIEVVEQHAREINPQARILLARSRIELDFPERVRGKRVLVIEDGPTLTHGEMLYGAGVVLDKPVARVSYELEEVSRPGLEELLTETLQSFNRAREARASLRR